MNKLKMIVIASLSWLVGGCGNDFLDISPVNNLGDEEAIENEQDLDYALNAAYTKLEFYRGVTMWDGDVLGDDMMETQAKSTMNYAYLYKNTRLSSPTGRWTALYSASYHVNATLEKAKKLKNTTPRYDEIIAELRFVRVILHWNAEIRFGPLPSTLNRGNIKQDALGVMITDELPENIRVTFYRDKVSDVFNFMITEMEAIVDKLPTKKRDAYLNYWAGKTFLARLYLYTEQWGKALACAKEVIEKGPYNLFERDAYIESWGRTYAEESIFEMPTTDSDNLGWDALSNNAHIDGYALVSATKDFLDLKKSDTSDIRFKVLNYDKRKGIYLPQFKYPGRDGNRQVCNPKVLRLSECYLIAAEGALRSGDPGLGGKYLSDLREKRSLKEPRKYDGGITLDDVLYERRLELFGEGHRAWDLWRNLRPVVRYNTLEERDEKGHWCDIGVIPFDDYRTIWPLLESELVLMKPEDRLTQQNPGY